MRMHRHGRAKSTSGNCIKCGLWRNYLQRDHIIPKFEGGSDAPTNIQLLCANCHEDKTQEERRRRKPTEEQLAKMRAYRHPPETIAKMRAAVRPPVSPERNANVLSGRLRAIELRKSLGMSPYKPRKPRSLEQELEGTERYLKKLRLRLDRESNHD